MPTNSDCAALLPADSVAAKVQTYAAEVSAHVPVMKPSTAQEGVAPVIAELRVTHQHLLTRLLDKSRSAENVVQNSTSLRLTQRNDPTELESLVDSCALSAVVHLAEHSEEIAMHTTVHGQVPIGQQHWSKSEQRVKTQRLSVERSQESKL